MLHQHPQRNALLACAIHDMTADKPGRSGQQQQVVVRPLHANLPSCPPMHSAGSQHQKIAQRSRAHLCPSVVPEFAQEAKRSTVSSTVNRRRIDDPANAPNDPRRAGGATCEGRQLRMRQRAAVSVSPQKEVASARTSCDTTW